jgi:hypothetical protein
MSNVLSFLNRSRSVSKRHVTTLYQSVARQGSWRGPANSRPEEVILEMQKIIRMAGEDGGAVKGKIALAARRLGLSYTETHRLWYGQRKVIAAHEADALRAAQGRILEERARRLQAQLDLVNARRRALEGGRDEAVA